MLEMKVKITKNHHMPEATPWKFIHACDLHLGSPRSYRYDPSRNENWAQARRQMASMYPDFILIGGDVTRDGNIHEWEYEMVVKDFESLPFPAFTIPGNQDVGNKHTTTQGAYGDGRYDPELNVPSERLSLFASYFGPINWTFTHKQVRFTGFYDAVFGSGLPEEDRLWAMLERLQQLPPVKHHVVVMHYALLIDNLDEEEFDHTKKDEYLPWYFSVGSPYRRRLLDLLKAANVNAIFSGHIHRRRPEFQVEGIRYFQGAAVGGRAQWDEKWEDGDPTIGFYACTVSEAGLKVDFIPVDPVSNARGYGPYGHPPVEDRDYSAAWEK